MFVLSLSWQNDHFQFKREGKCRFLTRVDIIVPEVIALRENGTFLSFPYVCPEPVSAK